MKKFRIISIILALVCVLMVFAGCDSCSEEETPTVSSYENAVDVNGGDLMLATSGSSKYVIVKPASANAYDTLAAQDLQTFLLDATGCKLPIKTDKEVEYSESSYYISVGATALFNQLTEKTNIVASYEELNEEGALIHLQGNAIYLVGAAGYGTLNAVYRFLEHEVGYEAYAFDEIYVDKMVDVHVKNFANAKFISKTVYRDFQFGLTNPASAAIPAARMGLISTANGGTTIEGPLFAQFVHSFARLVPAQSSPEGWWNNGQLCLTNPDAMKGVAEASKKYLLQYPSARYIMYGGEDDSAVCDCANCQAEAMKYGGHGALMLKFCNNVSIYLEDWLIENNRENVIFVGLNYLGYETAPAKLNEDGEYVPYDETCVARDNVGTFLCYPSADYGHSLDDPTSTQNRAEYEKTKAWAACTDNITVYLYWGNYQDYFQYFNAISTYQGWLRALQENGVDLVFAQIIDNTYSTFSDLKLYLLSKLSADADCATQEELTIDFMKHYYKAAATDMYELYNQTRMHMTLISALNSNDQAVDCYDGSPCYSSPEYYPLEVLNNFLRTIDKAYESVANSILDDEVKEKLNFRICAEEFNFRYYRYKIHNNTMTETEKLEERTFLNASAKKLGISAVKTLNDWIDL